MEPHADRLYCSFSDGGCEKTWRIRRPTLVVQSPGRKTHALSAPNMGAICRGFDPAQLKGTISLPLAAIPATTSRICL